MSGADGAASGRHPPPTIDCPRRACSFAFQSPTPFCRRTATVAPSHSVSSRLGPWSRERQLTDSMRRIGISRRYRPRQVHPSITMCSSYRDACPNQSDRSGSVHGWRYVGCEADKYLAQKKRFGEKNYGAVETFIPQKLARNMPRAWSSVKSFTEMVASPPTAARTAAQRSPPAWPGSAAGQAL